MSVVRVDCGRCGAVVGRAESQADAARMYREHVAECEILS